MKILKNSESEKMRKLMESIYTEPDQALDEASPAGDAMDAAIEFAEQNLGMSGKWVKKGNVAKAKIPSSEFGVMSPIIGEAYYVIVGRNRTGATNNEKILHKILFNFGLHWVIKGRTSKDTKSLQTYDYNTKTGQWKKTTSSY